jgi:hypothetical protein
MEVSLEKKYLSPQEVENIYALDKGTLANWRCNGNGPEFVKCGRKVLYSVNTLDEWLLKHVVRTRSSN